MKKIKAAIVGYGNIGRFTLEALRATNDFEVVGIVRRNPSEGNHPELAGIEVKQNISDLSIKPDVAILCTPSRKVKETAEKIIPLGINTVDSFDIHTEVPSLRKHLDALCKQHNTVSVISAGWDPGSDSVVRTLMQAMAPKGLTYTNFGPGMSMGHSVAARAIDGVRDALSMTIPLGTSIHRRMVYIELEPGHDFKTVSNAIKTDPYFASDETHVMQVESVDEVRDMGHGVNMTRKGVSGNTQSQRFEFNMTINNPALTGQILVCAARAAVKSAPGCYTMIEIPVVDLLPGERDEWIGKLV